MKNHPKTKNTKLNHLLITLLIISCIAPLAIAYAASEEAPRQEEPAVKGNYPEVPGVPDDALQYNKTDITPVAEMEQVAAGEPALFQYRNLTMLMNCSQNCEVIFTTEPEVTPKIFGLSIDPNQTMTLTMNLSRSPLQGEMVQERCLNFYLGIEPHAELQLQVQIRLYIDQAQFGQELNREIDPSRLTWAYWNRTRSEWVPVESYMDQNGYLVCNTDHFSTWTVVELAETGTIGSGIPIEYVYGGLIITVAVVAAGVLIYTKRK